MSFHDEERRSQLRTVVVVVIIIITAFLALGNLISPLVRMLIYLMLITSLPIWFVYKYLASRRGYQDRYNIGQELGLQHSIIAVFIAAVIFAIIFGTLQAILHTLLDDGPILVISLIVVYVIITIVDYYESKDTIDYVNYKQQRHQQFVDSLGDAANRCMSCQRPIKENQKQCPHCGYISKSRSKDIDYIE